MYKHDEVNSLGSVKCYQQWGKVYGLECADYVDTSQDLANQHSTVKPTLLFSIASLT